MKWTPQDVVALILALIILVSITFVFAIRALGYNLHVESINLWMDFLTFIAGGLVGWIGREKASGD